MASFLTVDNPQRRAPRGGLMAVANVIDTQNGHILQGITYTPDACDFPSLTPGSCWVSEDGGLTEKVFDAVPDAVNAVLSFTLHAGVECFIGPDDDFAARATRVLENGESLAVEKALYNILNAPVALATETTIQGAVARAEQWLANHYNGLGMIHMDRRDASFALQAGSIEANDNYSLETKQGVPVANGGGYGDVDGAPDGVLFATGQVNIWRTGIVQTGTYKLDTNASIALVERSYAITIDCGALAKITVDTTP